MAIHYSTHTLFVKLARKLGIRFISDIGCLDAKDSMGFKTLMPEATVISFEANRRNYQRIRQNSRVADMGIQVYNKAVTNFNGSITFYDYNDPEVVRNGISSTLKRNDREAKESYEVAAQRYDDFMLEHYPGEQKIALWIDVEGAAYNVLESIEKISDRVLLIHTELEVETVFSGQKLRPQIIALLERLGFVELGFVPHKGGRLGDSVFLKKEYADLLRGDIQQVMLKSRISSALRRSGLLPSLK